MNNIKFISPFKRLCVTVGSLPSSYVESMSYYECLTYFMNFLEKEVIPAINNNAEVVKELQDFVANYFDNLDVQEEINNKLDDMAESGELADIIAQYLQLNGILAFNTKTDLKNAENIVDGSICKTLGDIVYNDGKGYFYKIREILNTDIVDDENLVAITNNDSIVAERIKDYYIGELEKIVKDEVKIDFIYRGNNGGSCHLIQTETKNILIDLGIGSYINNLITYLLNNGINKIDYLIITHYHSDHVGGNSGEGFITLLNNNNFDFSDLVVVLPHKDIDWAQLSIDEKATIMGAESAIKTYISTNNINSIEATDNQIINIENNTSLKFNNIGSDYYDEYYSTNIYNNFTMLVTLKHNNNVILFTGDLEELGQHENIKNVSNETKVVTAPHHDLNALCDIGFIKKLNPEYCIIMNLYDNGDSIYWTGLGLTTQFSGYLRSIGTKIFTSNQSHNIILSSINDNIYAVSTNGIDTINSNILMNGNGIELPINTDLNNLKEIGSYFSNSTEISETFSNLPGNLDSPGPIRITNLQLKPYSYQFVQLLQTPRYLMIRQLINGTTWTKWTHVLNNGLGITSNIISNGDDLDDYIEEGKYEISNNTIYQSLSNTPNKPGEGGASSLIVMRVRYSYDFLKQFLITGVRIYFRTGTCNTFLPDSSNIKWSNWFEISTTELS